MKKLLVAAWSLWMISTGARAQQPADIVLLNGKIFTADPAQPTAQALAIRGERIVAVGTTAEITKLAGPKTRRLDVQGRTITPGFNDAHNHFSADAPGVHLAFKTMEPSWEETAQTLTAAAAKAPAGTWLFGTVGAQVVLNEQVNRVALDQLVPRHPVLLRAYYGHGFIANTLALQKLNIQDQQPDPLGGYFEHTATTPPQLNGRFWEYAQWQPSRTLTAQVSDAAALTELRQLSDEAVRLGITSMQLFSQLPFERFVRLLEQAQLPIRVRAIPFSPTTPQQRDLSEVRQMPKPAAANAKVKASGMKWVLDGTPYERGAALRQPYLDRPDWKGRLNFTEAEVARMVQESVELKQQLLVHCAGDRSAEVVLQALENNGPAASWPARRMRIEHGDGVVADLVPRAKKLGVVVVQNPMHFAEPQLFRQRWSPGMQPLGSLLAAGVPVALGSDGPLNPFLNIMMASLTPANPKEAITREQAVQAYTYGSAFAEFAEKDKGRIAVGQLADVVVLSQDIFAVPPPELPKTASLLTLIGGQVAYDAKVLK
ncbi:amidohydrolase [Microvirga sp. STR05]|uniref:Amidohydrolase n=1 Tax=Hymenobacter duratus TaxID=2771356 RepID=A0ABR8JFC2_9BACT|nr:amidohydrolase [Hymenobacter duratus]MBD2714256.1 amidohydrolase [Hymenobacter duratus]MBR7949159.1 amidohydrolase [Microvirga sp. STR05]